MKSLIIGKGEVGKALYRVLRDKYEVYIQNKKPEDFEEIEVLHICYPYSENFVKYTKKYQKQYKPRYTVIHSTVPMGTSRKCKAYHSPIRGTHPHLIKGIRAFVKYLAPFNETLKEYFQRAGIEVELIERTETTEALKLWSTAQYGLSIILEKEIYRWCKKYGLPFDIIYTEANKTYNKGYSQLGWKHVIRSILKHVPGPIGGSCIIFNCNLLKSPITKFIKRLNR